MNLNKIILTIATFSFSFTAIAQTISGKITNATNQQAIVGAHIKISKQANGAISNKNGEFNLPDPKTPEATLIVTAVGFQALHQKLSEIKNLQEIKVALKPSTEILPEVVIESSNLFNNSQNLIKTPGSVSYISPKQMQQFSYTDVNRALRTLPGVYIQEEDGFGLRPNIGMRGTGVERSSKITVMEDGILMAPAPYSAPAAYYLPTVGRMQSIEVMKGSAQISHGPQTTGGAINFISTPIPAEKTAQINLIGGNFNTQNLHAFYGENFGQISFLIETFQLSSNGFKNLPQQQNTGFNKQDYMLKLRVNTKASAKVYQSLTFKGAAVLENSNETYLGLTEADFKTNPFSRYASSELDNMQANQNNFSLTHYAELHENLEIVTKAYRNNFSRNWYKLNNLIDTNNNSIGLGNLLAQPDDFYYNVLNGSLTSHWGALNIRANNRSYFSEGVQTRINFNYSGENTGHKLSVGARLHRDNMDRFQWEDIYDMKNGRLSLVSAGTRGTQSNSIEGAMAQSVFAEYIFSFKKLQFKPGFRYENISYFKDDFGKNDVDRNATNLATLNTNVAQLLPGASISYNINSKNLIFVGVHQGFSPPGARNNTQPENSTNYELGFRHNSAYGNLQVVGFYTDYSNLVGSDLAAAGGFGTPNLFNAGEALTQGIELEYANQWFINSNWSVPLQLAYTFTHATFKNSFNSDFEPWANVNNNDFLPYIPQNTANFTSGIQHATFNIIAQVSYTDKVNTVAAPNFNQPNQINAFTVVDLSSEVLITPQTRIFFGVNNLTNLTYAAAQRPYGLRPGMPRNFRIGLKWRLS